MTERTIDRETAAKLAALGYVGASDHGVAPAPGAAHADPKRMIGVFNRLRQANTALQRSLSAGAAKPLAAHGQTMSQVQFSMYVPSRCHAIAQSPFLAGRGWVPKPDA